MVHRKQSGHIGGSFSIAEVISHLYSNYNLTAQDGDKLILSKGHSVPIIYAALHVLGFLSDGDLAKFREIDSPLQGHPHKLALPQIHATTGSLGQGLSIAIGHALGMRLAGKKNRVFCILGDGEVQEGQVWEAFMLAPHYKLDNLTCFIDRNGGQGDGTSILDPFESSDKLASFGWDSHSINGHNLQEIEEALSAKNPDQPKCIILNTIKGKGVSFMESTGWHGRVPTDKEYAQAMEELNESN